MVMPWNVRPPCNGADNDNMPHLARQAVGSVGTPHCHPWFTPSETGLHKRVYTLETIRLFKRNNILFLPNEHV